MNRNDYLEHFLSLLQLMLYQTTLPANEIDGPFFWRCSGLLCKSISRAADLGIISFDDYLEVSRIATEIRDQYEYAVSPLFPHGKSMYFSDLFRSAPKDDKGDPLKPVQLCSLLEQDIFKNLSETTQDNSPGATIKLSMPTRSNKPVRLVKNVITDFCNKRKQGKYYEPETNWREPGIPEQSNNIFTVIDETGG